MIIWHTVRLIDEGYRGVVFSSATYEYILIYHTRSIILIQYIYEYILYYIGRYYSSATDVLVYYCRV